jgi:hypothetical protein
MSHGVPPSQASVACQRGELPADRRGRRSLCHSGKGRTREACRVAAVLRRRTWLDSGQGGSGGRVAARAFPREHTAHGNQLEKRPRTQFEGGGTPASYPFLPLRVSRLYELPGGLAVPLLRYPRRPAPSSSTHVHHRETAPLRTLRLRASRLAVQAMEVPMPMSLFFFEWLAIPPPPLNLAQPRENSTATRRSPPPRPPPHPRAQVVKAPRHQAANWSRAPRCRIRHASMPKQYLSRIHTSRKQGHLESPAGS